MRARSLRIVAALGLAAALGGCNPLGYPDCYRVQCPYPPVYHDSYAGYVPAYDRPGRPAFGEPPFDDPFADYTQRSLTISPSSRQRSGGEPGAADGDALAALFQQHQHPRQRRADGGSGPQFRERRESALRAGLAPAHPSDIARLNKRLRRRRAHRAAASRGRVLRRS